MKKALFKSMSWILSVMMMLGALAAMSLGVSATQSATSGFSTNYTLSGDGFTDMVNIAMAQNEKTQGQIGYNEHWCADFVSDCARLAGQEEAIPFNGVVQSMYDSIINAGGYRISSPQAGDLVFFYNSGSAVQKGTPVTVTAKASGGSGSYSYAFYYKKSTSSQWTAIGTEFGTASTAVFTPAMAAAYNIKTVVMDSTGAIAEKVFAVVSAS